ncbi:hypothetical protein LUZ61_013743 [Rhynchospora tenuis]|uniref:Cystatin domain-containing protein n=1 Tax=Rhynchospora tenuis TaxID=198213 RepID=A0AAD5Z2W1_9POAL|nr:hypothetical protein LUZ61_013743 [Rhynchospora tenuis]
MKESCRCEIRTMILNIVGIVYTVALKHFAVLAILLVGATITNGTGLPPVTYPISNVSDPQIQSLGRFAVEEYDKRGESYLLFQMVYGGYVEYYPLEYDYTYHLDLTATNCSQSGALGNYNTVVYQLVLIKTNITSFGELKPKQT